jgi:hypothetical protein
MMVMVRVRVKVRAEKPWSVYHLCRSNVREVPAEETINKGDSSILISIEASSPFTSNLLFSSFRLSGAVRFFAVSKSSLHPSIPLPPC